MPGRRRGFPIDGDSGPALAARILKTKRKKSPYAPTRILLRAGAFLLLLAAASSILEAIDTWQRHEAQRAQLTETWKELAAMDAGSPFAQFWLSGWVRWLLAAMGVYAGIMVVTAVGLWRLKAEARRAAIALAILALLAPFQDALVWGGNRLASTGWAPWLVYLGVVLLFLWFLLRRQTRDTVGTDHGFSPRNPWSWMIGLAILVALVPAGGVIAWKYQLHRDRDFAFWSLKGPLEDVPIPSGHPDLEDWEQVRLLGTSLAVPPGARLERFPAHYDPHFMVVVLAAGEGQDRRPVLVTSSSSHNLIPPATLESFGATDGLDLARLALRSNWSYWPLLYRAALMDDTVDAYWMEDRTRQILATTRYSADPDRVQLTVSAKAPQNRLVASEPIYYLDREGFDRDAMTALAAQVKPSASAETPLPPGVERAKIQDQLDMLQGYWEGDLDAGVALAERLLEMDAPRSAVIIGLVDAILDRDPGHVDARELGARLGLRKRPDSE